MLNLDDDQDSATTIPVNKLSVLRLLATDAIAARDAIEDCFSSAWSAAHKEAIFACLAASDEMERLAKDPGTRYGSWRTRGDIELMVLGYI